MEKLIFALNGERHELCDADPSMSLLEFIRTRTRFRGPKLGCGEGGCGACVVLLSKYDPETDEVIDVSASSCLTLLGSINYCSITTTEGLGNTRDGHHAIHQRIAGFHASQCGFCTPGMCMSLFSSLVNADKDATRPEPPEGFSRITVSEAEKAIHGNLCRCTGYRPLVDACKSFAMDVDLEDLGLNTFWKKGNKDECTRNLPKYSIGGVCTFPDFLKSEIKATTSASNGHMSEMVEQAGWYRPKSIEHLHALFSSNAFSASNTKLVVGNTSSGIYKDQDLFENFIDLRGIPELSIIKSGNDGVELGAAVTISKAIEVLRGENVSSLVFEKIANHMNKVASPFVRNVASLGGNLILAQRNQFESDIATILLAVGTKVSIQQGLERVTLTLEEFLERPPCDHQTILLSIFVPFWTSSNNILFETYRASPRPLGNAVSYVNSAFLAQTSIDETGDVVVEDIKLAFGAYGTQHAIRAKKVEDFLKGKIITGSVFLEATRLLREVIVPTNNTAHPEYRTSLAVGFLFKFLSPIAKGFSEPEKIVPIGYQNGQSQMKSNNGEDLRISSRQEILLNSEHKPVGDPIKKFGAEIQASGEAVYVDDITVPKDCLHGAFIYSSKPLAHVKGITFKSSLASSKVVTIISAKDIPKEGENIGFNWLFGSEPLFADSLAEYAGQPLGLVIAETQRYANMAAKQAIVEYSTDNLAPPILSVEDAIEHNSYFEIPPAFCPKEVGNFSDGMAEADTKIENAEVKLASQYYFYMEPQAVLAIPDEDNCMTVYAATQWPEGTQGVIARSLGIPFHNVRVITRRIGGSFGAKAFRCIPVITACAVAAHKLRRPVKIYLDRQTDMIMIGGRNPTKACYTVGFKLDGKITALHVDLKLNAGISTDCSPLLAGATIGAMNKYNWGNLSFDLKVCKTNNTSKSAMRAPGDVQGSFIAEAIIEHVASVLSLDTNVVRRKNLHDHDSLKVFFQQSAGDASTYTLPSLFDRLASTPSYDTRTNMVKQFNSVNKWKKRGISCVPITYKVRTKTSPGRVSVLNDGSIVVEVGGIEIGQGLWTKAKQMTAYCLKELLEESEDLLEKVRVIQADSLSLVQGGITGGSTTSESSCEAVRLACNMLVERLKPLKDKMKQEKGVVSWDALISLASARSVNLSASSLWVPDPSTFSYINYGVAISEVEIDLLTGATTILRSDLAYDCGKSLNPAVDLGQVEGGFIQGVGFFLCEEFLTNSDGLAISDSTWNYKIPTVDTIPKEFNVEFLHSPHNKNRVLSSKASGEPPLLLASSVHCALREAIRAARTEFASCVGSGKSPLTFQMDVPTTMPTVKELCGLDIIEKYLETLA